MEMYTVTQIQKKYNIPRSTIYLKFKSEEYQDYVGVNESVTTAINQYGLDKMLDELKDTIMSKEAERVEEIEEPSFDKDLYERMIAAKDEVIQSKDSDLEGKEREIENLRKIIVSMDLRLEQAMELNRNNQVLLLDSKDEMKKKEEEFKQLSQSDRKKKKGFFDSILGR